MPSGSASRKARRSKGQRQGGTSTASSGLVLRVIKNDPEVAWLGEFMQKLGEKAFGVERFEKLKPKHQRGWIKFSNKMARLGKSMARKEGDFFGFLRFIERIADGDDAADLTAIEAEFEAFETEPRIQTGDGDSRAAEERRRDEQLRANLAILKAWRISHLTMTGLTVVCVVVALVLIAVSVITREVEYLGGSGIVAGVAGALVKFFVGGPSPFDAIAGLTDPTSPNLDSSEGRR